jgi:hypothetical protein
VRYRGGRGVRSEQGQGGRHDVCACRHCYGNDGGSLDDEYGDGADYIGLCGHDGKERHDGRSFHYRGTHGYGGKVGGRSVWRDV